VTLGKTPQAAVRCGGGTQLPGAFCAWGFHWQRWEAKRRDTVNLASTQPKLLSRHSSTSSTPVINRAANVGYFGSHKLLVRERHSLELWIASRPARHRDDVTAFLR
jgi:hypothetical protein